MTTASVLSKEKIVSLSELQKNPGKMLDAPIVRIVKNGKEIGIFMNKEEFEDFVEEHLPLKGTFRDELETAIKQSKKGEGAPLKSLI
ncbi:hypothetical protein HZA42_01760 [Candidatus Peregrinibacteria bacterium]|nr:hypothetical protein [Candidatus Peregrinibacteria bacterium]